MSANEAFRKRLQELMDAKELNPNSLANLCGVTPSTIYSLFDPARKNTPSLMTVIRVCQGLGMSLSDFFEKDIFDIENIDLD